MKTVASVDAARGSLRGDVYLIKSKARGKQQKIRREAAAQTVRAGGISPADAVLACRQLARQLGGTRHLLALVQALVE